jgi:hypothetical protein
MGLIPAVLPPADRWHAPAAEPRPIRTAFVPQPRHWLLLACLVLHIVPIWLVPHYPSQDGASLVYQAVVLRHYAHLPILWEHFTLNLDAFPNWLGFAMLQPLLACSTPAVAEKVLLTLFALALPLSVFWVRAGLGAGSRLSAYLSFPLIYTYCLQVGLYNFCLGLPLALFTIGFWWRQRAAPRPLAAFVLAFLLAALFFTHLAACLLTLAALLCLAALTTRRAAAWASLVAAAAPTVALVVHFVCTRPEITGVPDTIGARLRELLFVSGLAFSDAHQWIVLGMCALLGLLAVLTFALRRPWPPGRLAFAWTAVALLSASVVLPNETSGGGMMAPRLHLFAFLMLLPALAPEVGGRLRACLGLAVGVVVVVNLAFVCWNNLRASVDYEEYLSGVPYVEPESVVVPRFLSVDVPQERIVLSPLPHAGNVYGYERLCANVANWHASPSVLPSNFPVLARRTYEQVLAQLPSGRLYFVIWSAKPLADAAPTGTIDVYTSPTGRLRVLRRS